VFTLGSFGKITDVANIFGQLFHRIKAKNKESWSPHPLKQLFSGAWEAL
jgi:hypothetical protein